MTRGRSTKHGPSGSQNHGRSKSRIKKESQMLQLWYERALKERVLE